MYFPYFIESEKNTYSNTVSALSIALIILWVVGEYSGAHYYLLSKDEYVDNGIGYYSLFSSLIHNGITHALFNAIGLFIFGTFVYQQHGSKSFWYILLPPFIFLPIIDYLIGISAVGLSGSISALIGFILITSPDSKAKVGILLLVRNGTAKVPVAYLCLAYLSDDIIGQVSIVRGYNVDIAYWAHLAGFFYGGVIGYYALQKSINMPINKPTKNLIAVISNFFSQSSINSKHIIIRILAGFILITGVTNLYGIYMEIWIYGYNPNILAPENITYLILPVTVILISLLGIVAYKRTSLIYLILFSIGTSFNIYMEFKLFYCLFYFLSYFIKSFSWSIKHFGLSIKL